MQAAVADGPNPEVAEIKLAFLRAKSGDRAGAEELLERLQTRAPSQYVPAVSLAFLNGVLGRTEEALSALEQAYRNREPLLAVAKVFFVFDPVREHPRFQAILRELRLA
jgi:hypothetical protein